MSGGSLEDIGNGCAAPSLGTMYYGVRGHQPLGVLEYSKYVCFCFLLRAILVYKPLATRLTRLSLLLTH